MKKSIVFFCMLGLMLCAGNALAAPRDTLVIGLPADTKSMDPHATTDTCSHAVNRQVFESLVTVDPATNKLVPVLAERWEISEDSRSIKFFIKKGVKFHNGEVLTADDVIFTFKRAVSPAGGAIRMFASPIDVDKIKKIDDHTLEIGLKTPTANVFLMSMNHPWSSILNKKAIEHYGLDAGANPVGTGRYKFEFWQKGDRVSLTRFDDYHGTPGKLKRIQLRAVVEGNSRTIELESGAIQVSMEMALVDSKRVAENAELYAYNVPGPNVYLLCFDVTAPPYDNVKVRQAMDLAVARAGIVRAVLKGQGEPARGPISSSIKYSLGKIDPVPPYDVDKAKKLLAEAGFPKGFKGELWVGDRTDFMNSAVILQANFRDIGIDLEIKVFEWGTFMEMMKKKGHAPYVSGWWQGSPANDPYFYLAPQFHSSAIGQTNRSFLDDKELDAMLDKGAVMEDGPEREKLFIDIQRRINAQAPWISMVTPNHFAAAHKSLKGYTFVPSLINYFGEAYFEETK